MLHGGKPSWGDIPVHSTRAPLGGRSSSLTLGRKDIFPAYWTNTGIGDALGDVACAHIPLPLTSLPYLLEAASPFPPPEILVAIKCCCSSGSRPFAGTQVTLEDSTASGEAVSTGACQAQGYCSRSLFGGYTVHSLYMESWWDKCTAPSPEGPNMSYPVWGRFLVATLLTLPPRRLPPPSPPTDFPAPVVPTLPHFPDGAHPSTGSPSPVPNPTGRPKRPTASHAPQPSASAG